ncbi:type II TA system antitoxin MqsA family protein [Stenotrophomonas sp. NPDC077464]|uniref:type II TA system antitoxin MqsA family protein n=1 Tax=unclassified Stenotrophomonas TaxID=196198 RepID=UPI0037D7EAE3
MTSGHEYPTLASCQCPSCGALDSLVAFAGGLPLASGHRTIEVTHLTGQRCEQCGEAFLDDPSQARYVAAADALVDQVRREAGAELRRVRRKLRLSQHEAAAITGGGPNAFSRYETGKAQPVAAVFNLFHLLDRHPDLLEEIREAATAGMMLPQAKVHNGS